MLFCFLRRVCGREILQKAGTKTSRAKWRRSWSKNWVSNYVNRLVLRFLFRSRCIAVCLPSVRCSVTIDILPSIESRVFRELCALIRCTRVLQRPPKPIQFNVERAIGCDKNILQFVWQVCLFNKPDLKQVFLHSPSSTRLDKEFSMLTRK